MTKTVKTLKDTQSLAKELAFIISNNTTIMLNGEIGAGKTTFTQFIAKELCVEQLITSPSYSIINQYNIIENCLDFNYNFFYHVDLYRINSIEELDEIGFEDIFKSDSIVVIEWAGMFEDYIRQISTNIIEISIDVEDENRIFTIKR